MGTTGWRATTRRLSGAASLAALALALFLLVGPSTPAAADAPDAHGYWWRLQSGVGPRLTPPSVPEGGLWVTADPSGDQAVAALRLAPADGGRVTGLTLTIASSTGAPTVVACPATSKWEPAEAGVWDDRPDADCEAGAVVGVVSADAATISFDVAASAAGPIDLVLIGDPEPSGFFDVAFEAPGDGAFSVSASGQPAASSPPPTSPTFTPPTVAPRQPAASVYQPPPAGFSTPQFEEPPPPVTTPAVDADETAAGDASGGDVAASPLPEGTRQPAALLAFSIVAGGWWYRLRAAAAGADTHPLAPENVAFGRVTEPKPLESVRS